MPDEDPRREPVVRFRSGGASLTVPYEVMRWFMDRVEAGSARRGPGRSCGVLAAVRAAVPEADLPAVIETAFPRRPDGTSLHEAAAPGA
ncbi:hypothetical protein ACFV30_28710 [Streptomyces sp. NPDC059752]|uniref:hypothetical protein n=1 Tax=unclassified Streptomyces TaxID=2593676 RepID=UPI00365FD00A